MQRLLSRLLVVVLAVPFMVSGVALATESSSGDSTTSTTTTSSKDDTTQSTETEKKNITTRLQERKDALKLKLTTIEQEKIKTKCKQSQGFLGTLHKRIGTIQTDRQKRYTNMVSKLTALSAKLKAQGVDVTTLDADIAALQTKINTYNTDFTAYQQAVSDLKSMDCASDPTAFKASLEAARTALLKVRSDAEAIKAYNKATIKPLLEQIKTSLEKTTTSTSTTGGSQ